MGTPVGLVALPPDDDQQTTTSSTPPRTCFLLLRAIFKIVPFMGTAVRRMPPAACMVERMVERSLRSGTGVLPTLHTHPPAHQLGAAGQNDQ